MVSGVLCVVLISGFQGDPIAGLQAKGSFHILRAAKSQRKAIMWLVAHTLRPAGLNFGLSHGWDVPSAWNFPQITSLDLPGLRGALHSEALT